MGLLNGCVFVYPCILFPSAADSNKTFCSRCRYFELETKHNWMRQTFSGCGHPSVWGLKRARTQTVSECDYPAMTSALVVCTGAWADPAWEITSPAPLISASDHAWYTWSDAVRHMDAQLGNWFMYGWFDVTWDGLTLFVPESGLSKFSSDTQPHSPSHTHTHTNLDIDIFIWIMAYIN